MSSKAAKEKKRLKGIIKDMAKDRERFVKCPEKDFTRLRKLSFETVLSLLLTMNGSSTAASLLDYFKFSSQLSSTAAFVQQRSKLKDETMEYLFHAYSNSSSVEKNFRGYRLLAVDGSDLQIPVDPSDADSYYPGTNGQRHYSLLHLNALFDLENGIYLDALVQKSRCASEHRALTDMVDRSSLGGNVIVLADRGYEAYNNIAHFQEKGWNFLIRIKDGEQGISSGLNRPLTDEFDFPINLNTTIKQ